MAELIAVDLGPPIVTAVDFGDGPAVRCPGCLRQLPLRDGWLGQEIACPRPACDGRMRVNPFVVGPPAALVSAAPEPRVEGSARERPGREPARRGRRRRKAARRERTTATKTIGKTARREPGTPALGDLLAILEQAASKRPARKKTPWWQFWRRG